MIVKRGKVVTLTLSRDLVRTIKRGHPWVFSDALQALPEAEAGSQALLKDKKGRLVSRGFYEPQSPLSFRSCLPGARGPLDDAWARGQFETALALRRGTLDLSATTGYRLLAGEGDGVPGLVCDVYGDAAAVRLDGEGAAAFWMNGVGVGEWLADTLGIKTVWVRERSAGAGHGEAVVGSRPEAPVHFLENGVKFTADLVNGQKTGFFLDQRANRQRIRQMSAGKRVLNVFAYTGGFSVYAGVGGASQVTTIDLAAPAIAASEVHWAMNGLEAERHEAVAADAFSFFEEAQTQGRQWDLIIVDPPSFAPRRSAAPAAISAYTKLVTAGARVTAPGGLQAAASCSSHVDLPSFMGAIEAGISKARRRARVLEIAGQPLDHPSPLALPEYRYLKFVLMAVI